jgi:N-acetylmuramoyl-L-alanine amidase/putative methionine-R-sulfoxide reductase with GAF domain
MATTTTNPDREVTTSFAGSRVPPWPREPGASAGGDNSPPSSAPDQKHPSQHDALQALLAFAALHDQVRRRKALAARHNAFDAVSLAALVAEFDPQEQFILDEVLQLVAERAVAITGADGLAIALAENNEIVLRAAAGDVRPDVGARIDRDSAFSGACFRSAQIVMCDDTETDPRVNLQACRRLGARSMVAVPLCGRRRVIGLLEAFSTWPFAFNDSDVRNLSLLAELVLGALKPEDEDRFAESAQAAASRLEPASRPASLPAAAEPPKVARVAPPVVAPSAVVPAVVAPHTATPPAFIPNLIAPSVAVHPAAPPISVPVASASTVPAPTVRGPATPAADKKPSVAQASSAPAPTIPNKTIAPLISSPATGIANKPTILDHPAEKPAAPEKTVAADVASAAPELNLLQPEVTSRRPVLLILLVFIAICAAFAGGVWLLKTTQLGNTTLRTEKMPVKPSSTNTENQQPAAPVPAVPAANASIDAASDTSDSDSAPASPQELSKFPRVTGIRHWSSADSSTVVLDLEDQVQYEAHRLANPDRIYFDLRDTQLAPELVGKSIDVGDTFVSRIRVAQPVAGMTRIVLQTKSDSTFSVSLEPNPYRLVVEVRKIGATPKGAVNLFPNSGEAEKNKLAIVVPPPTKEDLQLRARVPKMRIVVDAGHGGWDLGTVGRRGLLEKDLVLEISQRLGMLLQSRLGVEVIYTRPDDNYITLDERASIANQSQADLFVSVHANYSDLPSARGVETYYTNFFSAPGAKDKDVDTRVAKTAPGAKTPAAPALSPADLHERIEQSRRLATSVQHSLYNTLSAENPGLRDRGIKEAGFVVLTESAMPGILAEVSFVSSPTDEQKLRSDGYREQIAEALYRGIARYAAASHGVKVASAGK